MPRFLKLLLKAVDVPPDTCNMTKERRWPRKPAQHGMSGHCGISLASVSSSIKWGQYGNTQAAGITGTSDTLLEVPRAKDKNGSPR